MREADDEACVPPGADDLRLERQLCFATSTSKSSTNSPFRSLVT